MTVQERAEQFAHAMAHHRVECFAESWTRFGWQCLHCGESPLARWGSLEAAEQASIRHHAEVLALLVELTP